MKRPFLLILIVMVSITIVGCTSLEYEPENTLSAEQREEQKNSLLTSRVISMTYKSEYSDKFDNQDFAKYVYNGVNSGIDWYKLIKENIYQYEDGTVRLNFSSSLAYEPETLVENSQIVKKREPGIMYFDNAMESYKSDNRFANQEDLNSFEIHLRDLLERISTNIQIIGYFSDMRIDLENTIAEANSLDDSLGIKTESLNEYQKTEYSACQHIGDNIEQLENDIIELTSYFDITWAEQ